MIKKFLLSILIICSCSSPVNKANTFNDSLKINTVRELFLYLKQSDSIILHTNDSALLAENLRLKDKISSTIEYALNGKEFQIKNINLINEISEIKAQKKSIESRIEVLTEKNETLIRQNENYKLTLNIEHINKARLEESLDEAKKLNITSLKITGIGRTLFNREIQTNVASKIKKVRVIFSLPVNYLAKKESKYIEVYLYKQNRKDFIKADTTINYIGGECFINLTLVGKEEFKIGGHLVSILINNSPEIEEIFKITK